METTLCSIDLEKLVRVLSALLTPVIALLASYIAWQQHKTNKNHFRLALLDRRLKVFDSTGELIGTVVTHGKVHMDDITKFLQATSDGEFLFGADVAEYLNQLYDKATKVMALEDQPDQESRQMRRDALGWFGGQGLAIKKLFGEYMAFTEID